MRVGCSRRQGLLITLFSLLLTSTCVVGDDTPCVVRDNGRIYDLNPLKSKTDYQMTTQKGRKLFLNVCQPVKTETFGLKDDAVAPSEIGAFIRRDHGDFSIGKFNNSISVFNSGPRFVMAEGSQCSTGNSNNRASSLVNFVCESSVAGFGSPQLVGSLPPGDEDEACAFVIEWKTSYACGISASGGFWSFFSTMVVILLILLASYTILGTLYNYFILHLEGLDSIPQFTFQSMLYHLNEALEWTKDLLGILLINYCSSDSGRGHNILPSRNDNPRTPNPVSHQAQVFGIVNGRTHNGQEQGEDGPKSSRTPVQPQPGTNPVSHHTQVVQSLSQTVLPSHSHPHQPQPQPQSQLQSRTLTMTPSPPPQTHHRQHSTQLPPHTSPIPSIQEERPFLLFSNEEQEQDEGDANGPVIHL